MKTLATLGAALLAVFASSAQPAPAAHASRLLAAEGRVEIASAGVATWTAATTNQLLANGDRVRTGLRSRATVQLSDRSILRLNELTTVEIRPPASGAGAAFEQRSGASYFFNRERPGAVEFRTPVASGAIRGTEFHLLVLENGRTDLALFDGLVDLRNDLGVVALASGEAGVVDPGAPPRKTAMLDASSIIQWVLYYPAILDPAELTFQAAERDALSESLAAYRAGDLLAAQALYPANRAPANDAERIYRAATLLAVGQVAQATQLVQNVSGPLADSLRQMIATVKGEPFSRGTNLALATEWMAESYALQAQSKLPEALGAALNARERAPQLGFAHARVAELQFSFGTRDEAQEALERSLELAPRNAQAHALHGFVLAAKSRFRDAERTFDHAIAIDPALANAWLGRGLVRIRRGAGSAGRQDLQVASTLEPQRSLIRSYLGKAWMHTREADRAEKELDLAKQLDASDPTPWLYSAILAEQQNRVNDAVRELERSQELNDNRAVFRSRLLLDQDKAIRSANLARIYQDAGMFDWSLREAGRAVSYDYANYSAHQFLANSYNALRDPRRINLRYEAPAVSEYFIANLLAPVGATPLSATVSQQEYTRLFDRDHVGAASSTEYFSNGDWIQQGVQYGRLGNTDWALEAYYQTEKGYRPNNDLERTEFTAKLRHQLTLQDTFYFEAQRNEFEAGDVVQYYDQRSANRTVRIQEVQNPNLFLGYHREWSPALHTLALVGRVQDVFDATNQSPVFELNRRPSGEPWVIRGPTWGKDLHNSLEGYTAELQQIIKVDNHTVVVGGRYLSFDSETRSLLVRPGGLFALFYTNNIFQEVDGKVERASAYVYDFWQPFDRLQLTAGVAYDHLSFPENHEIPPLSRDESDRSQLSPKAGFLWKPLDDLFVRGAYTRSLGGVFFDNSIQLEPTTVAGFNQRYRSVIPESIAGNVPGARFETFGLGAEQKFSSGTYISLAGEILDSTGTRAFGGTTRTNGVLVGRLGRPVNFSDRLEYQERTLTFAVNQLVGENLAFGVRYRLTDSEIHSHIPGVPNHLLDSDLESTLHQVHLYMLLNWQSGFFSQLEAIWSGQDSRGYTPMVEDESFWQLNAFAGYRFWRRHAEARVGVLNITDRNYQLNPLTLYSELPRERTFYASFKFYF